MTVPLLVLRHGPTAWNAVKRCQGRADLPLSPDGVRDVAGWRLPDEASGWRWVSSPLSRCLNTARLLGAEAGVEPALVEMDWGAWEGERLPDLRMRLGKAMAENEALGLDFRPERGESPREVQARLQPWLARVGHEGAATVAVTHRGVLRALYALATGWDMIGKAPHRLTRHGVAHMFTLAPDGTPAVERLNIGLAESP